MRVNIGGGAHITVPEVSLNDLHIHVKRHGAQSLEEVKPYIGKLFIAAGSTKHEALTQLLAYDPDGFIDVDLNEDAMRDEWSTDIGVGCKYFSQDAVIKLAPRAGIQLDEAMTPAEKLTVVQKLMEADDPRAQAVFRDIGTYLAYTVVQYNQFYDLKHLMLLGRVMSGKGGDLILSTCNQVLKEEFPALAEKVNVMLPDEKTRRVGQSVAAASLPDIRK